MALRSSLNPIPGILERLLKTHGMGSRILAFTLQQRWIEIVGEHVGRHTRPEAIRHHKLHLVAENSVWLQQLLFLKPALLDKLNAIGDGAPLTDIVLRVGAVSPDHHDASAALPPDDLPIPAAEPRRQIVIEETLRPVADPDLQVVLRRLFENSGLAAVRAALKEHPAAR